MDNEILELILNSGDARTQIIEAMKLIKLNKFTEARSLMLQSNKSIILAHKIQTRLLQKEAAGNTKPVQILMVHAQDHLMDAMLMRDIVENIIDIQEANYNLIAQIKNQETNYEKSRGK